MSRALTNTVAIVLLWIVATSLGCSDRDAHSSAKEGEESEALVLRYQGSVGNVTLPELAADLGYLEPLKLKFIGNTISGPQDIQSVVTGDVDFGVAFNGAIINLVAARAPITAVVSVAGIDERTYGGFYVLEGSSIRTARDLIGKKVGMNTVGAHSEFMLREYLARNGLTRDEIKQVTLVVVPPVSSELALRQQQIDAATLGGIHRDRANERGGLRLLFSDHQLFGDLNSASCVLANKFIQQHPQAAHRFVEAVAKAIEWQRSTPREEVIARFRKIIRERGRNEDDSLLQYWQGNGVSSPGGVIKESEYQIWIEWLFKDGALKPGQIKAQDVFTNSLNPFAAQQ